MYATALLAPPAGPLTQGRLRAVSETRTKDGATIRFKLHDKRGALVDLGRHLGMFTDNIALSGSLGIRHEDALEELK